MTTGKPTGTSKRWLQLSALLENYYSEETRKSCKLYSLKKDIISVVKKLKDT